MAKIEEIEGIGPEYAKKLVEVGVKTADDLLNVGGIRKERKELAEKTGFQRSLFLNG